MNVFINDQPTDLPAPATVQDALAVLGARPPFAVAVNMHFIPQSLHAGHALREGDRVEVIAPVTGG